MTKVNVCDHYNSATDGTVNIPTLGDLDNYTKAFQKALSAAGPAGIVYVPAGVYYTDETIHIEGKRSLLGENLLDACKILGRYDLNPVIQLGPHGGFVKNLFIGRAVSGQDHLDSWGVGLLHDNAEDFIGSAGQAVSLAPW